MEMSIEERCEYDKALCVTGWPMGKNQRAIARKRGRCGSNGQR